MKTYEIFNGDELKIAELIQRRRLQMLVHSCIYYKLEGNIIQDRQWDMWAKELVKLQEENPEISQKVIWYEAFKDWDASTGAFLPLDDEWVIKKAKQLLKFKPGIEKGIVNRKVAVIEKKAKAEHKRLF